MYRYHLKGSIECPRASTVTLADFSFLTLSASMHAPIFRRVFLFWSLSHLEDEGGDEFLADWAKLAIGLSTLCFGSLVDPKDSSAGLPPFTDEYLEHIYITSTEGSIYWKTSSSLGGWVGDKLMSFVGGRIWRAKQEKMWKKKEGRGKIKWKLNCKDRPYKIQNMQK